MKIALTNVTNLDLIADQGGTDSTGIVHRLWVECPESYDAAEITAGDIVCDPTVTVVDEPEAYAAGYEDGAQTVGEDVQHGVARITAENADCSDWADALINAGSDVATDVLGVERLRDEDGDLTAEALAACEHYNAGASAGALAALSESE